MSIVFALASGGLLLAALAAVLRLVLGSSMADRVVASNVLVVVVAGALALQTAQSGSGELVDLLVFVALLSFVGTVVAARFLERRGE